MHCKDCAYHVVAHYDGTPDDELYDECEYHWMVLHEDEMMKGCEHYTEDLE